MRIKGSLIAILATILIAATPLAASAQVSFGVGIGFGGPGWGVGIAAYSPPALPVYYQPPAPYPNYQWIPGYWGWGAYGYYWVPGYWTAPPTVGLYWTPGYWGYYNGAYAWNVGYWGPTVGFYGGINYGFGYFGTGFVGGYWSGGAFNYNTAVVNVNRTVINRTYVNRTVVRRGTITGSRVSYNGGRGGVRARATAAQIDARRHGVAETAAQRANQRIAGRDRNELAAVNHGHPRVAAAQRPFSATHRPSDMRAISAADRQTAQHTMNHQVALAHHNAAPQHGTVSAATHHSAPGGGAVSAHNYPRVGRSSGDYSHVGYGGHAPTTGSTHATYGGRPPSSGSMHAGSGGHAPSTGGGHAPSGGGHTSGGRPPRG